MYKNYYFPFHLGSGNRGCEGILRGTIELLHLSNNIFLLAISDKERLLDNKLGLNDIAKIDVEKKYEDLNRIQYYYHKVLNKFNFEKEWLTFYPYTDFFSDIKIKKESSLVLFTGGDLYCYTYMANKNATLNNILVGRGLDTILWGCSVEEKYLSNSIIYSLGLYKKIYCRESLSYKLLNKKGLNNISLFPDPAFVVKANPVDIGKDLQNTVGMNLSNFVNLDVGSESLIWKNILNLVDYIIDECCLNVLLIPHVFWDTQDDRIICRSVKNHYKESKKVSLLKAEDYTYAEIRYIIGKCKFFVGARTHAMISAYAMNVPALGLGYSIKSVGIAKDIGLSDDSVVDCTNLTDEFVIKKSFQKIVNDEKYLKGYLKNRIPEYLSVLKDSNTFSDIRA